MLEPRARSKSRKKGSDLQQKVPVPSSQIFAKAVLQTNIVQNFVADSDQPVISSSTFLYLVSIKIQMKLKFPIWIQQTEADPTGSAIAVERIQVSTHHLSKSKSF